MLQFDDRVPPLSPFRVCYKAGWDLARFYLVLASQLAVHRQQLALLIESHEAATASRGRYDSIQLRQAERGAFVHCVVVYLRFDVCACVLAD